MTILQLLGGLLILTIGAESLVRGASALALRLGISPLVVGLTVVALGTSAPELVVCVQAALAQQGGIALGNVVGSNIFNLAAILGIMALVRPIRCQASVVRREVPLMVGAAVLLGALALWFGEPSPGQLGRLTRVEGCTLLALALAYLGITLHLARRASPAVREEFAGDVVPVPGESAEQLWQSPWWLNVGLVLLGLALLALGADLLVSAASSIARQLGVSDLVIGLTIVGAGTSLPELATSAVAAYRGESDIALGNVVGSSIFNVVGILGATVTIQPLDIPPNVLYRDLPVMVGLALLCWPLTRSGHEVSRAEGAVLLGIYLGYLALLVSTAAPPA